MSDEYEYETKIGLTPKEINQMGLQGWELVSAPNNRSNSLFQFRRPKKRFIFDGLSPNERRFIEKAYKI